jgi:hypothetical protein
MLNKERRDFLWHVAGLAALIFIAAFGAYSGNCSELPVGSATERGSIADQWIAWFTGGLFLVGFGQAALFLWQLRLIRTSLRDSKLAAEAATKSADAALLNAEAVKLAERAYVKMSHYSAPNRPALSFEDSGVFTIKVRVKNHGRTPATVLTARFTYQVLPAGTKPSAIPDYQAGRHLAVGPGTFLVTDDDYKHTCVFQPLPVEERAAIDGGQKILWFYGYADYRDEFDSVHRSGYGRVYIPKGATDGNNLIFSDALEKYNYDDPKPDDEPDVRVGVLAGLS